MLYRFLNHVCMSRSSFLELLPKFPKLAQAWIAGRADWSCSCDWAIATTVRTWVWPSPTNPYFQTKTDVWQSFDNILTKFWWVEPILFPGHGSQELVRFIAERISFQAFSLKPTQGWPIHTLLGFQIDIFLCWYIYIYIFIYIDIYIDIYI